VLTSELPDPTGYGRVLRGEDGSIRRIVEQKDATADELRVREVGTSVYAFDAGLLREAVRRLSTANAQGEQYLTDVIEMAVEDGRLVSAVSAPAAETAGVNDRVQLAAAARSYNDRLLEAHMRAGVTILDPATTWVDASVTLEPDVTLLPGTDLHGDTSIGESAVVGPQTTLTDTAVGARSRLERVVAVRTRVGSDVTVGPFAYLRAGTVLSDGVHVGTYVELKNAQVGAGTKIPHLSYVGDATIGEYTNIGAATVFVNYDGVNKHHTTIGSYARTGADNMFVAPVTVGDGAYTAAGAVITKDVPAGALGRSSARQQNVPGWVAERRPGTAAATAAASAGAERQDEE
jgi:bifunctional UDP-N-acetylglucosamine pyrophosphorylase/glucosamine-1-phosphate N-acetyltransferase